MQPKTTLLHSVQPWQDRRLDYHRLKWWLWWATCCLFRHKLNVQSFQYLAAEFPLVLPVLCMAAVLSWQIQACKEQLRSFPALGTHLCFLGLRRTNQQILKSSAQKQECTADLKPPSLQCCCDICIYQSTHLFFSFSFFFSFIFPHRSSLSIVQNDWSRKEYGKVSAALACCLSIPSPARVGENVVGRGQD